MKISARQRRTSRSACWRPMARFARGHGWMNRPSCCLRCTAGWCSGARFDTRPRNLQRQGRITTYAPVAGQEAIQVGCGLALRPDDWLVSTYRDGIAGTVHGLPPEHVALFFRGHPRAGMVPPDVNVLPQQVGSAPPGYTACQTPCRGCKRAWRWSSTGR